MLLFVPLQQLQDVKELKIWAILYDLFTSSSTMKCANCTKCYENAPQAMSSKRSFMVPIFLPLVRDLIHLVCMCSILTIEFWLTNFLSTPQNMYSHLNNTNYTGIASMYNILEKKLYRCQWQYCEYCSRGRLFFPNGWLGLLPCY